MNLKKLILLNLPYLLFVYPFDKLSQAIRLAPGADLSAKLLSIGDGFTAAFSSLGLSLDPVDLLVGIAGAVILRVAVHMKGKNAKKYRHGMEYGSARWGTSADIAPYMDKDFFQNIPMTMTERITMSSRPKQPKYARNKNILVIGGSGSGKTRFFCKPSLLQGHSSYVCTDPKGTLLPEIGTFLERQKYRIKCLNLINFKKSMRYNPLAYIRSEKDILKLVNALIMNTKGEGDKSGEDFWVKAERLYYSAENYNPLFIYGDSGLGKTHLLYAIAHQVMRRGQDAKIVYIKGDEFTIELVNAIREGKNAEFREKYRQASLLLVDDIQFIAGKQQTQEEFFHTFNTLYESGKQIVLTSDRPPREMTQLEDRLRTRFEWGLMVDVAPPDFETRMAIIKTKAALLGVQLPDEISGYIAENVTANVRQIEGTLNKILAYRDLLGDQVDEEAVSRAVRDMLKKSNEYIPSAEVITEYICKYYNMEPSVLYSQSRSRDVVNARNIAMYLIRRMTNLSLVDIGKAFGGRDHSTVLHSLDKVEKQMRSDPAFAEVVKEITTNINSKR